MTRPSYFVLTGGPGGGKSTLLSALGALGHAVSPEAGRAIIRDQARIGGRLRDDQVAFAETILTWEMRSYRAFAAAPGPVFFDRGVADVAASWREVCTTDEGRTQQSADAVRTYDAVVAAYERFGYDPVELPRASVGERVAFVLERV